MSCPHGRTHWTKCKVCTSADAGGSEGERSLLKQCRYAGLPEPVREHVFHDEKGWRLDLSWVGQRVACEVDGATWSGGRHVRGAGFENDCLKLSEAAIAGWLVIRATTAMVDDGRAVALIERALAARS